MPLLPVEATGNGKLREKRGQAGRAKQSLTGCVLPPAPAEAGHNSLHTWLRDSGSGLSKVLVTKGDLQLHQGQAASSTGPHIPMAFAGRGRPCPLPSGMSQLRGTLGLAQVTVPPDNPISAWEMSPFGSFQAKQRQIHHLTLHYLLSSHHHRSSRDAKHLLAAVGCRGSS